MNAPLEITCAVLALPFAVLGLAKIRAVDAMTSRAAHIGFSVGAYRAIGVAEVAGAAGLLLAHWVPAISIAALIGLTLLMLGALVTHLRNGDGPDLFLPALVMLVALIGVSVGAIAT